MTNGLEDKTRILQQTMWKTENNVEFVLNDFGGDPSYKTLYHLFLDNKSLVLLVYDAESFSEENFYSMIGQWLDLLATATPGVVVKIVGTKDDLLHPSLPEEEDEAKALISDFNMLYPPSEASRSQYHMDEEEEEDDDEEEDEDEDIFEGGADNANVVRNTSTPAVPEPTHDEIVRELVQGHQANHEDKIRKELDSLQEEIARITAKSSDLNDMEESNLKMMNIREEKLTNILKNPLKVLPQVAVVSASDNLDGIMTLINELEHLAIDTRLFPHAQKRIPGHWIRMRAMLKQRKGYYLYWEDLAETAKLFSIKGEELHEAIQYLHDTADVLWYQDVPGLSQIVFHKPKILVEILASLYRHDILDFLKFENKIFISKGRFNHEQFDETVKIFLSTGEISRPLLNCLWFHMNFKNSELNELLELLPLLEVCYVIPEPTVPTGPLHNRPLMVVPWYNSDVDFR